MLRRFGEGETPTTTLFIGTEQKMFASKLSKSTSGSIPLLVDPGVEGVQEKGAKAGRIVAGTDLLLDKSIPFKLSG